MALRERAASILRAPAAGKAVSRLAAAELAAEWVAATGRDIALDVMSDGDVEVARIIELCGRVLQLLAVDRRDVPGYW